MKLATVDSVALKRSEDADGGKYATALISLACVADDEFLTEIGAPKSCFGGRSKVSQVQVDKPAEQMGLTFYPYRASLADVGESDEPELAKGGAEMTLASCSVHKWTVTRSGSQRIVKVSAYMTQNVELVAEWFARGGHSWAGRVTMTATQKKADFAGSGLDDEEPKKAASPAKKGRKAAKKPTPKKSRKAAKKPTPPPTQGEESAATTVQ